MNSAISATAKIEGNQKTNGSVELRKAEPFKYIPEKGPDGENGFDKKKGKGEEISALTLVSPLAYKLICHLQDKRVSKDMIMNMDSNLRVTKGLYMIKYIPTTDKRYRKGRPWCIGQDLIHMGVYVSGAKEWNKLCDKIPELDWIRRNSTFKEEMFMLTKMHPGMAFWFAVDWLAYYNKLKAQAGPEFTATGQKQGIEQNPFGAYKCSAKEYREHYKDKTATLRVLHDVLKEVQEVEMSPAVQEEMLAETGEAAVTRSQYIKGGGGNGQPRDPETGRFLHKDKNKKNASVLTSVYEYDVEDEEE